MNLYAFDWERKFKKANVAQFGPGEVHAPNMTVAVISGRRLVAEMNCCSVDDIEITSIEFESVVKDEYGPRIAVRGDFMPDGWRPPHGVDAIHAHHVSIYNEAACSFVEVGWIRPERWESVRHRVSKILAMSEPAGTDIGHAGVEALCRAILSGM